MRLVRVLRAHGAGELSIAHVSRTPNLFKLSLCIDVPFGMATGTFAPIGSAREIRGEVKK